MKIAIVTFHAANNFGAVLQAHALQSALDRMGHESRFVHIRADHQLIPKYRRKQKASLKGWIRSLAFKAIQGKLDSRTTKFAEFVENRLITTRRYTSVEDMVADPPDVDAYICGSDQIWNLEKGLDPLFFLGPAPDTSRKISYAPSFGTPDIPDELKDEVARLINRIDHLSVREKQAVDLVRHLTGRTPVQVCDPVFLLDTAFWEERAVKPRYEKPYMVFYSLDCTAEVSKCVSHLSSRYKLPVVVLAKSGAFMLRNRTILALESGPEEFLGWIRHASLVATNSFHATAFSIHFEVPFVTLPHPTRNTRMESILDCYHLGDRLISNFEQLRSSRCHWLESPFHDLSRSAVQQSKVQSLRFLEQSLEP